MRTTPIIFTAIVLLSISFAGCLESEENSLMKSMGCESVEITSSGFSPSEVNLTDRDCVLFTNTDGVDHTVTADDGSFDISLSSGDSGVIDFTDFSSGTYSYHCKIHTSMTGKVIVSE